MPPQAPGTAELYEQFKRMCDILDSDCQRRRAMFLSWVNEMERHLDFGEPGHPPTTAQKNKYWRDAGKPNLSNY